jgi:hypothetical protein
MGRTHHQASARSSADLLSREQESHRKTQTALTTREEFLAIVSHDLRNPLNHIFMAAQNLFEEPGEQKRVQEIAASIKRSAGEMLPDPRPAGHRKNSYRKADPSTTRSMTLVKLSKKSSGTSNAMPWPRESP